MSLLRTERDQQEEMGHPVNMGDPMVDQGGDYALKLAVLGEEFGEVSREVYELSVFESEAEDPTLKLRTELLHLAAVTVAWLEAFQREYDERSEPSASATSCKKS